MPMLTRLGYSSMWTMELPCFGPSKTFYQESTLKEYLDSVFDKEFNKRFFWGALEFFVGFSKKNFNSIVSSIEGYYWKSFIENYLVFEDTLNYKTVEVPVTTRNVDRVILTPRVHIANNYALINQYFVLNSGKVSSQEKHFWLAKRLVSLWSDLELIDL